MADLERRDAPFDGRWWLPDDPSQIIGGRLELEGESWRVVLFGWLGSFDDGAPFLHTPRCLFGRVGTTQVTLLELSPVRFSSSWESEPYEAVLSARTVIVGAELVEGTLYTQASVRLLNLNEWANRHPWSSEHEPDEEHGTWRRKEIYTDPGWLQAELPGAKVSLFRTLGTSGMGSLSELTMTSNEYVQFLFDSPFDLAGIEHDYIRPLKYLVELASATPSAVLSLSVGPQLASGDTRMVNVLSATEARADATPKAWFAFLFGLGSVPFEEIIPKWWALHTEIGPVSDLIAGLWDGSRNISNRFLDAASAIEGYHRHRFPGEDKTFAERVDAVVALADPRFPEIVGDPVKWRNWVRDGRNSVAHRDPGMVDLEQEWRTTIGVAESMQLLLILVLLTELGIPDTVFAQGFRQSRWLESAARYLESVKPEWFG